MFTWSSPVAVTCQSLTPAATPASIISGVWYTPPCSTTTSMPLNWLSSGLSKSYNETVHNSPVASRRSP